MNAIKRTSLNDKRLVTIKELQEIYSLGKNKLDNIGYHAGAIVRIGRSKLYNLEKMQAYFDNILANKDN